MTSRLRNRVLNVRLSEDEAKMLGALAAYDGAPVSSWVRHSIRDSFRVLSSDPAFARFASAKTASPRKR
jgi:hypothetical protein